MAPNPGSEPDYIREKSRRDLLNLLEGVRGKKNLVLGKDLAGPIGLFVSFTTLQEHGVQKVFLLENGNTDSSQRNIVYLVHGEKAAQVQAAAEQIKSLQKTGSTEHEISIFWVPRRTLVSDKILEENGILGDINILDFPLYFLPLETDVLSLELNDSFNDLYLCKDPTSTFLASKALMQIQQRHGYFPRIIGKGDNAKRLADLLIRGRKELNAEENSGYSGSAARGLMSSTTIENLIIIDRDVDFATVLLTQLTYEGLIDELVGIQNNQAEVDSAIAGAAPQPSQPQSSSANSSAPTAAKGGLKRKIQLDSADTLYSQLRDTNFAIVGSLLNKVARRLESDYESRHVARTTTELREFVNKLPAYQTEHQSLRVHTNLAEEIMKHTRTDIFRRVLEVQQNIVPGTDPTYQHESIEELISMDAPLSTVLRLLCLESCIAGGLRPRDLETFKRQILQAYGYQHLMTLDALEKMDLLQPRSAANALLLPVPGVGAQAATGTKTNYNYLRKALRLIVDEVNEQDPNDIAYVYSGYAPLSIRLVQCIIQKQHLVALIKGAPSNAAPGVSTAASGWLGFEEAVKSARGATFNIVQKGDEKASKARQGLVGTGNVKTIFVMFLGGITFTEIAALRFVGKQLEETGQRRKIMICTTGIISGKKMMDAAIEKDDFSKKS